MPVYAYKCDACGKDYEQFQHFTDDPLTVCPFCHAVALRKVYLPVGIVFKGKGFYATDNRSPSGQSYKPHTEGESSSTSKSEAPASGSESSPAPTSTADKPAASKSE